MDLKVTLWKCDCWLEIMHVGYKITNVTMYPCLCMVYKYNESMFARNVMLCCGTNLHCLVTHQLDECPSTCTSPSTLHIIIWVS